QVLGAPLDRLDTLAGQAHVQVFRNRPAQAPLTHDHTADTLADEMRLDTAASGFDFGKFRHGRQGHSGKEGNPSMAGGWRLEAGQCADLRLTLDKLFRPAFQPPALLSASTPPPSPGCSPSARRRRTPTARRIRAPAERSPATRDPRPGHR